MCSDAINLSSCWVNETEMGFVTWTHCWCSSGELGIPIPGSKFRRAFVRFGLITESIYL